MSDAMIAHVPRLSNPDLSSGAHKLFILLAHHTNYKTGLACPGHRLLAQEMRVTERHIKRLVRELVKSGQVDVIHGEGRGHLSTYRIKLPPPEVIHRKGDMSTEAPARKGDIFAPDPGEKGTFSHPPIDEVEQREKTEQAVSLSRDDRLAIARRMGLTPGSSGWLAYVGDD
jgi:hypothetical protein